jgi:hypothetical protein
MICVGGESALRRGSSSSNVHQDTECSDRGGEFPVSLCYSYSAYCCGEEPEFLVYVHLAILGLDSFF